MSRPCTNADPPQVFLESCEGVESFEEAGETLEQLLLPGTSGDSVPRDPVGVDAPGARADF